MTPSWKDVPGYEGLYLASDTGAIRSYDREVFVDDGIRDPYSYILPGRTLKQYERNDGYLRVNLYDDRGPTSRLVHSVILETFEGPRPEGLEICHGNGNRTDNRVENLRYDTKSANMYDSVRHGTHRWSKKKDGVNDGGN